MAVINMVGGTEPQDREALVTGLRLAQSLGTEHLACSALPDAAAAVVYATSPYMVGLGAGAVEQVRQAQADLVDAWRALYDETVAGFSDVRSSYEHRTLLTERASVQAGVLADVLVFPRPAGRSGHTLSPAFETVMLDERLPVLLAGSQPVDSGAVAIAWDGSPQVARSVRFHIPLIRAARRVLILQNPEDLREGDQGPASSVSALQGWLGERGVTAEARDVEGDVGKALLSVCGDEGIDILVAGAFGHSRAGEFLFGGASRDFLRADSAPALAMAH